MSAEQFAVRARVALCAKWPEMTRYNQSEMLQLLEESHHTTDQIVADQGQLGKKAGPGRDIPPPVGDVAAYLKALGSDLDPQDFMDFYQTKDWTVDKAGRVKMKDWRSAARRADRLWTRTVKRAGMSEWERTQKEERLKLLRVRLKEITNPGGSAWPVSLDGAGRAKASELAHQIHVVEEELKRV